MKSSLFLLDLNFISQVYSKDTILEIKKLTNLLSEPFPVKKYHNYLDVLKETEIVFSGWGGPTFNKELLDLMPKLEVVFYAAGSIKKIVSDDFFNRQIKITTANQVNALPVAQFTVACIVFGLKKAHQYQLEIKKMQVYPNPSQLVNLGVYEKTIGLVSFGAISKEVVKLLKNYKINIQVYDPFLTKAEADFYQVKKVELNNLFESSDVVSIHTPLLQETRHLIKKEHLLTLKEGAVFINTARGAIIDELALIEVFSKRKDLFAYLDVVDPEPPVINSQLYSLENVFLTPHLAGSLGSEISQMGDFMLEELKLYLNNQPLKAEVNKEMFLRQA